MAIGIQWDDPQALKAYYAAYGRQRRAQHRERLAAIKLAAGCVDCGYVADARALQFDHVRGNKVRNVCEMASSPWAKVVMEIEKCEVRCANCHSIRTHPPVAGGA